MKKQIVILLFSLLSTLEIIAQQIPFGSCGFVYIHDAAGCRIRRLYYCNNGGPYPNAVGIPTNGLTTESFTTEEIKNLVFQEIDALYPNPTSGQFSITFSTPLSNAVISITDANGKTVQQVKATGNKVGFDLSNFASGIYFVKVEQKGTVILKKVIKQ